MNNNKSKNFALMGAAGFIAPRHLKAIKDTGNNLVAALDPHDSVGILDSFFPEASFFTEFERFERFVEKERLENTPNKIDYISICTPNYLHDSHIRAALRLGANVICEKPIVLNPWNIDYLEQADSENPDLKINTVLQLRLHETIKKLKKRVENENKKDKYNIELTYITSRGLWYDYSWKGVEDKSGGITTNIGVHFFDMLLWVFGDVQSSEIYAHSSKKAAGTLELEKANVKWYLSLDRQDLPEKNREGNKAFRTIKIDGEELEFSQGFTELHTKVYEKTLKGEGFTISDAKPSITLVHNLRNAKLKRIPSKDSFFKEKLT